MVFFFFFLMENAQKQLGWISDTSHLQIPIDVVVDILVSGGMQYIVKFSEIIEHAVGFKEMYDLLAGQRTVYLIAFHTEYGKFGFVAHG